MSMYTCENRAVGISKFDSGAQVCRWTLERWHCKQVLSHYRPYWSMFGQIYRSEMRRWLALMPGLERLCSESNIGRRNTIRLMELCKAYVSSLWSVKTLWWRAAPTATSKASIMTQSGASGLGWHNSVALARAVLALLKAEAVASVHTSRVLRVFSKLQKDKN